jgi:hypothetical protein
LWPSINSNGQLGQLLDWEEWTFSNMPLTSEQLLKDLNAEMTVLNFVEQEKLVRQFKHLFKLIILKIMSNLICISCFKIDDIPIPTNAVAHWHLG